MAPNPAHLIDDFEFDRLRARALAIEPKLRACEGVRGRQYLEPVVGDIRTVVFEGIKKDQSPDPAVQRVRVDTSNPPQVLDVQLYGPTTMPFIKERIWWAAQGKPT